jgi:hypothetical protein
MVWLDPVSFWSSSFFKSAADDSLVSKLTGCSTLFLDMLDFVPVFEAFDALDTFDWAFMECFELFEFTDALLA